MNSLKPDNSKETWDDLWEKEARMQEGVPATVWRCHLLLQLLEQYIPRSDEPLRIIDFGCGPGVFLKKLSAFRPDAQLLGIDQSDSGLGYGRKKIPSAEFCAADLAQASEPPENFRLWGNAGVCSEVLEHVQDPVAFLRNMASFLNDRSILLITVPGGPQTARTQYLGHLRHYTQDSIRVLLQEAQYDVIRTYAAGFPFYNLYQFIFLLGGKRLILDPNSSTLLRKEGNGMSPLLRTASAVFRFFMKVNMNFTPWGWQIVAVAKKKKTI